MWHTPINTLLPTIISQRAVTYVQIWWKYFKLRKRIKALKDIQVYLNKIQDPFLYIEESIYNQLPHIFHLNQTKSLKFLEQNINFSFGLKSNKLKMTNHKSYRMKDSIVPEWLDVDFNQNSHSFLGQYEDDYQALFHCVPR